jgi:CHAD domain-containing protein
MDPFEVVEIERKFEVDDATRVPDFSDFAGCSTASSPHLESLTAVYFDTSDFALAKRAIVVRRRSGGNDAGWHVKLREDEEQRRELHWPLESSGGEVDTIPEQLLTAAGIPESSASLHPIAVLRTERMRRTFRDDVGNEIGEFCEDQVRAERVVGRPYSTAWREWELEASGQGHQFLAQWASSLLDVGATPARYEAKLVRALGDVDDESVARAHSKSTQVGAFFSAQRAAIIVAAAGAQLGNPDSIHDLRVACRTTRAVARALSRLKNSAALSRCDDECHWLATEVGAWRDIHVVYAGIGELTTADGSIIATGKVADCLGEEEQERLLEARLTALLALRSERFDLLMDTLAHLANSGGSKFYKGGVSPKSLSKKILAREAERTLRKLERVAGVTESGSPSFGQLHTLRKRAKRLRYVAEFTASSIPKRSRSSAKTAEILQTSLGEIQDLVVMRAELERIRSSRDLEPDTRAGINLLIEASQAKLERAREIFIRSQVNLS